MSAKNKSMEPIDILLRVVIVFAALGVLAHDILPLLKKPQPQEPLVNHQSPTKPHPSYTYNILEVKTVTDGDSGWLLLDLGFNVRMRVNYRLLGVDTPELRGPEHEAGVAVKRIVVRWLLGNDERGRTVVSHQLDKYGRSLATIYNSKGHSLNAWLLENGLALPYDGGTKPVWTTQLLDSALLAAEELNKYAFDE